MADFHPILSRAIAALPVNTPETRRAIYERARTALLNQLRSVQPAMSEADIARQSDALGLATLHIEAEYEALALAAAVPMPVASEATAPEPKPLEQLVAPVFEAVLPSQPLQQPEITSAENTRPPVAAETDPLEASTLRPRVAIPPKPGQVDDRRRKMVVGGGIGAAVLAIAVVAYVVNSAPPQTVNGRAATGVESSATTGKQGERVGQDVTSGKQELLVAQRAVLYIESQEDPQKPRTVGGRVAWRLDSESGGQGRPVETVVRATVEIPESGLTLIFTIRRNTDAAFPASHILGLRFSRTSDDGNGAVKEAGVPQFKADEGERGAPLSAITSSLGDNLFVSALSKVPVEVDRNVDLMTRRNWIDVPVRFASGKRGIVAFEKGFSGDQMITDAFNRWR